MLLTTSCQICGQILSVVEKDQISDQDISDYQLMSFCDTYQNDGVTQDGQGNLVSVKSIKSTGVTDGNLSKLF